LPSSNVCLLAPMLNQDHKQCQRGNSRKRTEGTATILLVYYKKQCCHLKPWQQGPLYERTKNHGSPSLL
jgi:hypothetical protein